MRAGSLDRRITLQRVVETQSGSGASTGTWLAVASVWAEKRPQGGTEAYREGQIQGWANVIWRIRYIQHGLDDPTVKWRLLEGDRVYEILSISEIGRREGWELVTRCRAEDQKTAVA